MKTMKRNDLFIDVSSHNGYDITGILEDMGTQNTIIKISEGTSYLNPCLSAQVEQSNPVGFYHFAWFGGDSEEAENEAHYFLDNVPKKVKYLVLDYEDHAGDDVQDNTNACLRFMQVIADAGYSPIYYSYKPFTLNNIDYQQILAQFPNSLWIAGYGLNDGNADFNYFPSMDGIRWWQYSSNPYDKNIVLLDDEETVVDSGWKRNDKGWWYVNEDGNYPTNKWQKIKDVWYYFDGNGYMYENKWLKHTDGLWYYLGEGGAMADNGWKTIKDKKYYFTNSGAMKTGWLKDGDNWYYLDANDGDMKADHMVKGANGWYYLDKDGVMVANKSISVGADGLIKFD